VKNLQDKLFNVKTVSEFHRLAIDIFRYQYRENSVYRQYVNLLGIAPEKVTQLTEIPFLPINLFKTHRIVCGETTTDFYFQSSGTTNSTRSKHFISDLEIYKQSFVQSFKQFYGDFRNYCFLALLPTYLEQPHSSLIFMMDYFIQNSSCTECMFLLDDFEKLASILDKLEKKKQKTLLFGVSYALLDFASFYKKPLQNTIVMETGGMKGKREELTKKELHRILQKNFGTTIHSEYGMTELLSQAYSKKNGKFYTPPWMKILIRDRYDPFSYLSPNKIGGINIIDLANINSCCFIETQDLGKFNSDDSFELFGRFDVADTRGCNLMIEG